MLTEKQKLLEIYKKDHPEVEVGEDPTILQIVTQNTLMSRMGIKMRYRFDSEGCLERSSEHMVYHGGGPNDLVLDLKSCVEGSCFTFVKGKGRTKVTHERLENAIFGLGLSQCSANEAGYDDLFILTFKSVADAKIFGIPEKALFVVFEMTSGYKYLRYNGRYDSTRIAYEERVFIDARDTARGNKLKSMLSYSTKPYDDMKKSKSGPSHWMGFELEVNAKRDRNTLLAALDDAGLLGIDIIAKRDGSLNSRYGVELVSRPMAYYEHKVLLEKLGPILEEHASVDDTCGLHVHVSRATFKKNGGNAINAVSNFVIQNKSKMEQFARRRENSYCAYRENTRGAVNLGPSKTIEFRMFASTTNILEIRAALAFCRSLCRYCDDHYGEENFSYDHYLSTLNLRTWPVLKVFIPFLNGTKKRIV